MAVRQTATDIVHQPFSAQSHAIIGPQTWIAPLHRPIGPRDDGRTAKKEGRSGSDVLTARERAFVEQYLLTANGSKSAEAAGYAGKSAKVRIRRLRRRPRVIATVKRAQDARTERLGIDADRVLAELEELAFSNIAHYVIDPIAAGHSPRARRSTPG
jgi:Terminase small subunit